MDPFDTTRETYDRVAGHMTPRILKFPPWVRTVVVSPETGEEVSTGESGLLQVFDLANAFSVIAIETEDIAVQHGEGIELKGRRPMAEARGCSLQAVPSMRKSMFSQGDVACPPENQ